MSESDPNKAEVEGMLRDLRGELGRKAERAGSVEEIAGGPVDLDQPQDFWSASDDDLENELWSRLLELNKVLLDPAQALSVRPPIPPPAGPGPRARFKSAVHRFVLRLIWPRIGPTLEKQDLLNRRFQHLQFIQFLAVKRLRQRLRKLEDENRKLSFRLGELEIEKSPGDEPSGHE